MRRPTALLVIGGCVALVPRATPARPRTRLQASLDSFLADRSAANYAKIAERVRRDEATVLQPLRAAMIAAAASAPDSLSEEQRKQLRFQPIALKGHMLELGQALDAYNLDEYVSKSTGETYPGGKVERELEEVGETCDDFLDLLAGKAVEQRKD